MHLHPYSIWRKKKVFLKVELLVFLKDFKEETLEEDMAFRKESRLRLQAEPWMQTNQHLQFPAWFMKALTHTNILIHRGANLPWLKLGGGLSTVEDEEMLR